MDDEEPSGGVGEEEPGPDLLSKKILELFRELVKFLEIARLSSMPSEVRYVLLFSASEIASAIVIALSGEKKLKSALCKMKSSRRVNRALAILRREGLLNEDSYKELRKCLRALRCLRNLFIHPICVERCPELDVNKAMECVENLAKLAREYAKRKGLSLGG